MKKTLFLIIFTLFSLQLTAQIKIKELPPYDLTNIDQAFTGASSVRQIIPLRTGWKIYNPDSPEKKTDITNPSAFEGAENLVYEREISFSDELVINNILELVFLGINYSGEILVNDKLIYKHPGGELPFSIELPKDILNFGTPNKITINLHFSPNANTTIPFKTGFLFPKNLGGITRDVFIRIVPNTNIKNVDIVKNDITRLSNANIRFRCQFEKSEILNSDSTGNQTYSVSALISDGANNTAAANDRISISFSKSNKASLEFGLSISDVKLWSPDAPNNYTAHIRLYKNNELADEVIKSFSIFDFSVAEDNYSLNGEPFVLKGTTYSGSFNTNGNLVSYSEIENDLNKIKETGFNAVRFSKEIAHPYSVYYCSKIGLLAFVELPSNSIPVSFIEKESFEKRAENYLRILLSYYSDYSALSAVGLGSSYLADSPIHMSCINRLSTFVKKNYNYITYASFTGYPKNEIGNLDLYGIEVYSKKLENFRSDILESINSLGKQKIFVSEVTYPYYNGSKNGYDNPYTIEAQAKYINDFIGVANSLELNGYFINSLFDYSGEYSSFYSGYNKDNVYKIGLLGLNKDENNIAYKVLKYNLGEGERVTIPIGTKESDSPLFFILIALGLAVIMGLVINSKRKFREDASRALLRPYNFYADIRDHRVLSGFHTIVLMLILAGSHALLQVNLLYYLRTNLLLEKLVLSTGSPVITSFVNYLSWNPLQAFIYLFVISLLLFVVLSLIIKIASMFIKTRVMFSSIYFVVIWAFLPFALMLPLELILYKILQYGLLNYYIYGLFVLFSLWIIQRIMKGVFVIFDVPSYRVYMYTLLLAIVIIGGKLLYFQLSESTIDYIITSIKQFQLM